MTKASHIIENAAAETGDMPHSAPGLGTFTHILDISKTAISRLAPLASLAVAGLGRLLVLSRELYAATSAGLGTRLSQAKTAAASKKKRRRSKRRYLV